jgi:ABC-type nitrate/sulfonate/bicarbonate transport system substrate-binding protein
VSFYSSHYFLLCRWLEAHQIDPKEDVIITVIPPEQMLRNLISANIDGFCVGEPWNSFAVEEGYGWCPTTGAEISKGYPDKVFATTERFYRYRPDDYRCLLDVLRRARALCESIDQRAEVLNILSKPQYLNCTPSTLAHAFGQTFPMGDGRQSDGPLLCFHDDDVYSRRRARMQQVLDDLVRYIPHASLLRISPGLVGRVFREELDVE